MTAKASIIFVNYNAAVLISDCIESIHRYNSSSSFEIICVDNHSREEGKRIITEKQPGIKWIQMDYNAGFARANNEGIRQAGGEVIVLLNPDILFDDDSLQKCVESFVSSEYVTCSIQLQNADKSPQISGGYFITGGVNNLLPLPVLGSILKWTGNIFGVKKTSLKDSNSIREVDWVNGAFMMIKRDVIEKAGLMDEDFFLYAEEIEWCSRIRSHGKICVYGNLHAIHLQGETANQAFDSKGKGYYNLFDRKGRQILISNFLRIRKQFGAGWFIFHLICYFLELPFFFLFSIFCTIFFIKKYSLGKFAGFVSNLFFLVGKIGKIISNKPYFYKVI